MFKWFAESFEKLCTFCATVNFLVFVVIGGIVGKIVGEIFYSDHLILLFIILGLVIAFFINVMTFGFISQITEMRRSLSEIEKKYAKIKKMKFLRRKWNHGSALKVELKTKKMLKNAQIVVLQKQR